MSLVGSLHAQSTDAEFVLLASKDSSSFAAAPVTWTLDFDSPSKGIGPLTNYDGKLYAGGAIDQSDGHLYVYDGATWADTNLSSRVGVTVDMVQSLQVFNGRLYIGVRVNTGGHTYARVYYYDGTIFVEDLSKTGYSGWSGIEDLVVHNNALYAANGSSIGEVYQRNGDHDWVTVGSAIEPASPARALASFNGSLYAGTGASGNQAKVWRWDGATWVLAKNLEKPCE